MSSYCSPIEWLILMIARPVSRSWDMVDLRYDLINFSFEKLLSAWDTVTGRVSAILRAVQKLGWISDRSLSYIKVISSRRLMVSWFPAQALYCPNQSALQSAVWCLVHCAALSAPHMQDLGNLSKPRICFPHFPMWKTSPWWLTWLHQQQHWRIQPPTS